MSDGPWFDPLTGSAADVAPASADSSEAREARPVQTARADELRRDAVGRYLRVLLTGLKYLSAALICAYVSFPLIPLQSRYWKALEVVLWLGGLCFAVTAPRERPLLQWRDWPCGAFLAALAAGLVAAVDHDVATQRYGEMVITMVPLYYIGKAAGRSGRDRLVLIMCLCLLGSAAAVYALWFHVRHLDHSFLARDVSIGLYQMFRAEYLVNFHPTILGNYLVFVPCFALALLARRSMRVKAIGGVTLALGALALLIPYWRAAPYVFLVILCGMLLLKRSPRSASLIVPVLAGLLFLGSTSASQWRRYDIRSTLIGRSGYFAPHRTVRRWASWSMWKESPLVGVGFDHYWTRFDKHRILYLRSTHPFRAKLTGDEFEHYWRLNRPRPERSRRTGDLDVADNMYCTLLAETGLIGIAGFLLLACATLGRGIHALRTFTAGPDARAVDPDRRTDLIIALAVFMGILLSMVGYDLFYWRTPFMLLSLMCGLVSVLSVDKTGPTTRAVST